MRNYQKWNIDWNMHIKNLCRQRFTKRSVGRSHVSTVLSSSIESVSGSSLEILRFLLFLRCSHFLLMALMARLTRRVPSLQKSSPPIDELLSCRLMSTMVVRVRNPCSTARDNASSDRSPSVVLRHFLFWFFVLVVKLQH